VQIETLMIETESVTEVIFSDQTKVEVSNQKLKTVFMYVRKTGRMMAYTMS